LFDTETQQAFWKTIKRHPDPKPAIYLGFGALVFLALALRLTLIKYQTLDYDVFSYWYDVIGFHSFKYDFSNYTAPYLYTLYFFKLLPLSKIVAIKGAAIIFDFLQAYAVYLVVTIFRQDHYTPPMAGLASLFLPTVFINSAFWGQIDATYTSLTLFSLYFALKARSRSAWAFFGAALAFKPQAVFFLPALSFMSFKRINWYDAWWAGLAFLVMVFPPVLVGRPLMDVATIYLNHAKELESTEFLVSLTPSA
jgi:Gpi18-like mannosyltransferase